ncbi:MAG: InlB B-repeat-containing protein [Clostridiales bacterium]|nr:InlB B-repeat-containing protein [Clostridiales bacterium]
MKKPQKSLLLLLAVIFVLALSLSACTGKVTMKFVTNGGTEIKAIKAKAGEDITPPADPTREGYTFAGWYLEKDFSGVRQEIPSKMPEKNVTYYAKWTTPNSQVTLTLDASTGGTLANSSYAVTPGTNLSNFLKDIVPTVQSGLEFAGWYNGDNAVSESDTMPNRNLTLKAKYYVNYTLNLYEQDVDGNYPATAQTVTEKAFYGEQFTYTSNKAHFHVDSTQNNKLSSNSLGKGETFTAYLARDKYSVYYFNPANSQDFDYEEVLYGNTVEIVGAIFSGDGLRFAAWTQTVEESDANGVYYFEGDKLLVDMDYYMYAQWDVAYYDLFGGTDYLFIPHLEDGLAILDRIGIEEKYGTFDKTTNAFSFEEDGTEMLSGKVVGNAFYYYRDSVEKVYTSYDGSSATLEMKAGGVAVYIDKNNAKTIGTYDVNDEGFYLFQSDTVNFVYRLELVNDGSYRGVVQFRIQSEEAGYYIPATNESNDGVVLYYLNGFGEGWEIYSKTNPYYDEYYDAYYTELPLIYYSIDEGDNFVTYSLYSVVEDSYAHMFDFRLAEGSKVVNGQQTKGSMLRGDGFTGVYHPNRGEYVTPDGEILYLDGFGGGTYGGKTITYESHSQVFFLYDMDSESVSMLYDYWVSFRVVGESKEYKIRPRSLDNYEDYDYDWIDAELFGIYEFENGFDIDGETLNALIYVFAGYSEAAKIQNCAVLLIQIGDYGEYPLWIVYDYNEGLPLKATNGVYELSEYGTRFIINSNGYAELEPEKQVEITFFDDANGKLVIDEEGVATYTPKDGVAHTVQYVKEQGYGYTLYALYIFDLDGTQYVFAYFNDYGNMSVIEAEVIDLTDTQTDSPVRMVIYDEYYGFMWSAAIGFYTNGSYYYALEGNVYDEDDGIFSFEYSNANSYDKSVNIPKYLFNFYYSVEDGVFTILANTMELENEEGSKLVFDGFGNATLTTVNGEITNYQYLVYYSYVEYYEENIVLYALVKDGSYWLIKVDEEENTFKFVGPEAGYYDDLASQYQFIYGTARYYYYIVLDGDGTIYYVETTGYSTEVYVGEYVKVENKKYDEYAVTVQYGYSDTLSFNIILFATDEIYFVKDVAQEADYDVEGGGHLSGDGYGYYEGLGYISLASYTDADGITYQGILEIGEYDDSEYDTRLFSHATTDDMRKVLVFTILSDGSYQQLIFDLVTASNKTVAQMRTYQSGAFRLVEDGRATNAKIYLDGHGNATLYDASGAVCGNGTYQMATEIDDYAYRYIGDDNETVFLFAIYMTANMGGTDGYIYEYAVYVAENEGEFISQEWAYLLLDGYMSAIYVDKYGALTVGSYGYITDWLVALYPDNQTDTLYFELLDDNTFRVAQADNGFIIRDGVLYAYVSDDTEITIPASVTRIAKNAFAASRVTKVNFNNVTRIDDGAFYYSDLTEVISDKITYVGARAFAQIYNLTTVNLPGVVTIGEEAFFGSRVTSMTLGAIESIGDRAFSHVRQVGVMVIDLTGVANATAISWGKDVFTCSEGASLNPGNTISVRIVVTDINAVNALYTDEGLASVKDNIGFKSGEENERYYNFTSGGFVELSGGLVKNLVEGWWELEPGKTLGLYKVDGDKVTVYLLNEEGTAYNTEGSESGTLNGFTVNNEVYVALGRDVQLTADDSKTVVINLVFDYNGLYYSYEVSLNYGDETLDAQFDAKSHTIRFTDSNNIVIQIAITSSTTCTVSELGRMPTLESDNEWRVTFLVDNKDNVEIENIEWKDTDGWETATIFNITKVSQYKFRAELGDPYNVSTKYTPYLYYVTYVPQQGETAETVTVEYIGSVIYGRLDNGAGAAYVIVDLNDKIIGIENFTYNSVTYIIEGYTANADGTLTVKVKANADAETKTYILKVLSSSGKTRDLEKTEVTE